MAVENRDFNWLMQGRDNQNNPGVSLPADNSNLDAAQTRQTNSARSYRDSIPARGEAMYSQYASQAKRQLAQNLKDVDKDYNRRGLLRSGMRTGAQYGQQAATANDLAGARSSINAGLLTNADQLDSNAYNTANGNANLGITGLGSAMLEGEQTKLDKQQADAASQQQIWNTLFKTGGAVAGGFAKPNYGQTTYSPTGYGNIDRSGGGGGGSPQF